MLNSTHPQNKMASSKRMGRKRKYEKLLDELQEKPSIPREIPNEHNTATNTDISRSNSQALESNVESPARKGQLDYVSLITDVLIGQALNLVPPCFKDKRIQYLANIVSASCSTVSTVNTLPCSVQELEVKVHQMEQQLGDSISLFGYPNTDLLWNVTFSTKVPHTLFLGPPVNTCLKCTKPLKSHNFPSQVICFGLNGPLPALKITLRCTSCCLNFRYDMYGSENDGFRYYDEQQEYVKGSRSQFIHRSVYQLFTSSSHHAWCSFEGFAEVYNEMMREISVNLKNAMNTSKFVKDSSDFNSDDESAILTYELSRKIIAEAFWNAEVEAELREMKRGDHLFHSSLSREELMMKFDEERSSSCYKHLECGEACKSRGCGTLWSIDGLWKLVYPICMHTDPMEVSGFSGKLNYVESCPNQPVPGKALCRGHSDEALLKGVPTGIKEYLSYCSSTSETVQEPTFTENNSEEDVEVPYDSTATVLDGQGVSLFVKSNPTLTFSLDTGEEISATKCNKDTGAKKQLQKWTRGHLFIVRGGGHIDMWQPLYQSEGPAQVFLIVLSWMVTAFSNHTREQMREVVISYDNMCNLDNLKVAREPLPLPDDLKYIWLDVCKIIDSLHIRNHKRKECHVEYNPVQLKNKHPSFNTMSCEQTFAWLGRYKKILASMGKCHHHFFLHRVIKRRNKYITFCYSNGRRPVQPKARYTQTK